MMKRKKMLNKNERTQIEASILSANKKTMKDVLVFAEMALTDDKYQKFRHVVLNSFGKSGLQTAVSDILNKHTEEKTKE